MCLIVSVTFISQTGCICKHTHGHIQIPDLHMCQEHSHLNWAQTQVYLDPQTGNSCLNAMRTHTHICAHAQHAIHVCTHYTHACARASTMHLCPCAYATAHTWAHTHTHTQRTLCAHINCEIQPHRVSCRRNWP